VDDPVSLAIREVADRVIVPRFQSLTSAEVEEKTPGDFVTIADKECEEQLAAALVALEPDVPMLGEEAASNDPALPAQLMAHDAVWVVDPLDGTGAFIDGEPDFAVMVAKVEQGVTVAGWIYQPMRQVMWSARRGAGAYCDSVRMTRYPTKKQAAAMTGFLKTGFMDPATRENLLERGSQFADASLGPRSAGFAYPALVEGDTDFLLFWRTLPWDHAAGALIAEEAGCHVARLDGSAYRPADPGVGLLAASDPATWSNAHNTLFPR
jgi:fructose-1,6-bisphosphatase/inositol monophosphatase family enzyme